MLLLPRNATPSRMNDCIPQPSEKSESDIQHSSINSVPEQVTPEVREAIMPSEHLFPEQAGDLRVNQVSKYASIHTTKML